MSLPSSSSGSNDNGGKSGRDLADEEEEDDDEEFYDADPLPILGRCKALYSFEGIIDLFFKDLTHLTHV